jgi:hypothetical protein
MNTTPVHALTDIDGGIVVDPAPRLAGPPVFGGPGNAAFDLVPVRSTGRETLRFDFPGVSVGSAHYEEGPTGATVIHVPAGARTAVDARGGAVGLSGGYDFNHAICLAGGAGYGLEAGAGVSDALLERLEHRTGFAELQLVSSAVIYDFSARSTAVYPDKALGRAALEFAVPGEFPQGRAGAGMSASAGKVDWDRTEITGQGAAFRRLGDVRILAVVVPNPVGVIMDRAGGIVRGNYDAQTGVRRHPVFDYQEAFAEQLPPVTQAARPSRNWSIFFLLLLSLRVSWLQGAGVPAPERFGPGAGSKRFSVRSQRSRDTASSTPTPSRGTEATRETVCRLFRPPTAMSAMGSTATARAQKLRCPRSGCPPAPRSRLAPAEIV